MPQKRFGYHVLGRYVRSFSDLPDGVLATYNYAVESFDERLGEKIFGFAEFSRKLTKEETEGFRLAPAVLDDTWV